MQKIGIINFSVWHGILVYSINDEKIKFKSFRPKDYNTIYSKTITSKMRYNAKGEPYFKSKNQRIYLNEIMRVWENDKNNKKNWNILCFE